MSEVDTYIKKGLKVIQGYLDDGNLAAALKGCEELLRIDPSHSGVRKMYEKVRELIIKDNEKRVDADIAATMHLWDEKKYEELARIYRKLISFAPHHEKLRSLMKKLGMKIEDEEARQRAEFLEQALDAIEQLLRDHKYSDAVGAANELLTLAPLNSKAKGILKRSKKLLIEHELEKNQRIVDSSDFERAIEFYRGLLAIDPENGTVTSLQKRAMEHLRQQEKISGKISANEGEVRIKQLFDAAEYEKVIQACDEVLRDDPTKIAAKIYRKKAEKNLEKESDMIVRKKMQSKEYRDAMRGERKKNPQGFITV
ncbi:hypothetical protein COV82_06465 [Candidatus Peregrinibacteria bacterium CG11_big_fil_rev_8_21_14_0_20_46_8]|nr:MAG: hypothetical protein COV82_06465 [Candidatus Peregrinibacteria bacterium CG11_big_fil_rev_8_21_14_0_20_46_8]